MSYDNTNTGVLFGNFDANEPKEDRKPNFDGSINVDGREYRIAGWIKTGKPGGKMNGRKFLSLSVQPKSAAPAQRSNYDWKTAEANTPAPRQEVPIASGDFDDEIPF